MASPWSYKKVEDIAQKIGMGPFGSSIKVETFVSEGIPIISGQHLHGFRLDEEQGFNFISEEHAERLKSANVYRGDVIFTHAGNIENVAYIPQDSKYERYVVSQRQFYMRCDLNQVLPTWIVYYFNSTFAVT
jgi:type I restriction enzyme S subunit